MYLMIELIRNHHHLINQVLIGYHIDTELYFIVEIESKPVDLLEIQ